MKITPDLRKFLKSVLDEDTGKLDITTETIFDEDFIIVCRLIARQDCILAGMPFFKEVFRISDKRIKFLNCCADGTKLRAGSIASIIKGNLKPVLRAERVGINIISHLSGIATYTNKFVKHSRGSFKILDTRKTLPGLRILEKYAVRVGGGYNHRFNLSEMILIKDNHINLWAKHKKISRLYAIKELVSRAKKKTGVAVEVEIESCDEALTAMDAGADILMFDNTGISEIKKFLSSCGKDRPLIEVSGGIDISDIKKLRKLDIDFVSVGRITHSAPSIDFSLEIM